jgi:putative ABC transport system substrate-binding protein
MFYVGRREFIIFLGGATAAWPLGAHAQPASTPVIGFLSGVSPGLFQRRFAAFRQGLKEMGFGNQNVATDVRSAEGYYERLPTLAADLVDRRVDVIVAYTDAASLAAKAATTTIPVVFLIGNDPLRLGLVPSLNRPGENITGVSWFGVDLVPKQLSLLHELVPNAAIVALLEDLNVPGAASRASAVESAARTLGLKVRLMNVRTASDIDLAFSSFLDKRADALLVGAGAFLVSRRDQITALAARHAIPAIYGFREYSDAGGLISYGNDIPYAFRRAGVYTGRILKGDKPADLPVDRTAKFELVINLKTAKALGLAVPMSLLGRADDLIE